MMNINQYERELVKVNDVILHVVKAGPEDGPLVVLLHGFPEFWYGWRNQIDPLVAAGYRVLIPDQRGYNMSDKPKAVSDYSMDKLTADINGLIRWAGRDTAHVIGHDWGGLVAWMLAMTNPRRVTKLGILNVPHPKVFSETLRSSPQQMLKSWYAGFFQIPGLPEALLSTSNFRAAAQALQKTSKRGTFSDEDIERYREAWAKPGAMRSMINWYRAAVQHPQPKPDNVRLKMPVLMIWGVKDTALSLPMASASIALCDNGKLITIPDATHWVQHDAPEQVNRLLLDFLAE